MLVPLFAFLEACIGIGLLVSGVFLLGICVLLYTLEPTLLPLMIGLAFTGALVGDHTGYYTGHVVGPGIWRLKWIKQHQDKAHRVARILERSAPWAVCLGRLSPPIRSLTPLVAGISGLTPIRFLVYDLLACSIWATALLMIILGINAF